MRKLNAFTVAACVANAYAKAFVWPTIRSGFVRSGIWNHETFQTDISSLEHLFRDTDMESPSLDILLSSFMKKERSLLREADVEEEGRIRIRATSGANVTADCVLEALEQREQKKKVVRKKKQPATLEVEGINEGRPALKRYAELADRRIEQCKRLRESRSFFLLVGD